MLLGALGGSRTEIVRIHAGAPPAFMLAMRQPAQVRRLVLMESLLDGLPGADRFLAAGPPWWFGFHAVPGLGETVLAGHGGEYLDWFLRAGTVRRKLALLELWVPITSSTSCDQAVFVDRAAGGSVSSDAVLVEIDRLG